jgi:hypothetical protein
MLTLIDEREDNRRPRRNLIGFMTARIGDDTKEPGRLVGGAGSRFDRPSVQAVDGLRRQHADADFLNKLPDALDVALFALVFTF